MSGPAQLSTVQHAHQLAHLAQVASLLSPPTTGTLALDLPNRRRQRHHAQSTRARDPRLLPPSAGLSRSRRRARRPPPCLLSSPPSLFLLSRLKAARAYGSRPWPPPEHELRPAAALGCAIRRPSGGWRRQWQASGCWRRLVPAEAALSVASLDFF